MKVLLSVGKNDVQLKELLKKDNIKFLIKLLRKDIEFDKDRFKKRGKILNKKFKLMKELLVLREYIR